MPVSPRAYPLVGHLPLLRDVLTAAAQLRSLGDVVKLRLPPHDVFVLNHPRDIEQWLVQEHAAFRKEWSTKTLDQVLGQGPLISEAAPGRRARRLAKSELSTRRVEALVPRVQACVDGLLAHLLDAASKAPPARRASAPPSAPSAPSPIEARPSERPPSAVRAAEPTASEPAPQPLPEPPATAPERVGAAEAEAGPASVVTPEAASEPAAAESSTAPEPAAPSGQAANLAAPTATAEDVEEAERPTTLFPSASVVAAAPTAPKAPASAAPLPEAAESATPLPEAAATSPAAPSAAEQAALGVSEASAPAVPDATGTEPGAAGAPLPAAAAPTSVAFETASAPLPLPAGAQPGASVVSASATFEPLVSEPSFVTPNASAAAREGSAVDDLASAVRPKLGGPVEPGAGESSDEPSQPGGAPWDLLELMLRLSLDVAVSTLLGPDTDSVAPALQPLLEEFLRAQLGASPTLKLPDWLPTPGNRRARANHARLAQILATTVAKRREAGEAATLQPDLLARLLRTRDDAGALLADTQVNEEALAHLLVGHEPAALLLTFAIMLVSQHPDVERRLLAELDERASYPGESPLGAIERLPYLDAVLRETLRLYPVAYAVGREALADTKIGDCAVPRGAQVWAFQWSVQRDPRFFHLPDRFRPERWIHGETRDLPRFAYFPLAGGLRASPGAHFVMVQVKLALARLLPRLVFQLVVPGSPALVAGSSLRPKDGVPVFVSLR